MFTLKNKAIDPSHYTNTLTEINQQPAIWRQTFQDVMAKKEKIEAFFNTIAEEQHLTDTKKLRVIFTGAGTSEYVGNTVRDYLSTVNETFQFESIGTTSLVSTPHLFFKKDVPTLLVSFARSGNSPESLAAVHLAEQLVDPIYQMAITCAPDGKLAMQLNEAKNSCVLIMPEGTNDKAFAMTSSFSSMLLSALLVFDPLSDEEKKDRVNRVAASAENVLTRVDEIHDLIDIDFARIAYLGSGSLYALAKEARLKILELTAGMVAAIEESSMGFRHGPKSFINPETVVVGLVSNDAYTRQYDTDILNEVAGDEIAKKTIAITPTALESHCAQFVLEGADGLEDVYLALPEIVVAQLFSLIASVHVGNLPDTPSKTGTVNRVVKGVEIHNL